MYKCPSDKWQHFTTNIFNIMDFYRATTHDRHNIPRSNSMRRTKFPLPVHIYIWMYVEWNILTRPHVTYNRNLAMKWITFLIHVQLFDSCFQCLWKWMLFRRIYQPMPYAIIIKLNCFVTPKLSKISKNTWESSG